ncbi:m-AAA protease-interacting protein 1, mitochondrial-like isoform X2 [Lycorma delicatula]|uniref:m-AAA protease-interacting protein 1, mitochondrial-like isoform X2 n=1 Tax=Lycorma delicatula TaxID=130591 RepID=UPI003F517BA1
MSFLFLISQILNVSSQSNKFLSTCNLISECYKQFCYYNVKNNILNNPQLNIHINTRCFCIDANKFQICSYKGNKYFSTTLQRIQCSPSQSLLLVRFPNPVLWAKMKWRFRKLNYFWDPEFSEEEFIRGAKQAVVTITHLISENKFDELQGLLTKEALQKLRQEVTLTWPEILKQHIALDHNNIKAITPINIRMMANMKNEKRFCDVDILYIALKRIMHKEKRKLNRILVFNILTRFHRNYSDGEIPNWTVGIFTMDVVAHNSNW